MNILILQTTESGVYYHRQFVPHYTWCESGADFAGDHVAIVEYRHFDKVMDLVNQRHYDIVVFSVAISYPPQMPNFVEFMKRRGTRFVLDIDDLYKSRSDVNKSLKIADAITVTSDYLANHYFIYGNIKYPYVIENGIDSKERQFQYFNVENHDVVFGYLGSTRHENDLKEMKYDFSTRKLFVVCEEYQGILKVDSFSSLKHWTEYAWEYNNIDVALAPLVPNPFNGAKSFLKVIEAGFKKKAIICSDTAPYNRDIHKEFRGVIDLIPNGTSWKSRVESYTVDEAKQRGEELYKLVQPFEIRNLNKKRRDIYLEIIGSTTYRSITLQTNQQKQKSTNYTPPKKRKKKR